MEYVIFDLEWNRDYTDINNKCPDEIIEIGAVKIDMENKRQSEFHSYIKPNIYQSVNRDIKKLTGITDDLLDLGIPFSEAIQHFKAWVGEGNILMSWGTDDLPILRSNSLFYNQSETFTYLNLYIDLQYYVVKSLMSGTRQIGLTKAADSLGISYDVKGLHSAIADALLSGEIFKKVYAGANIRYFIMDGAKAGRPHNEMSFKHSIISDFSDAKIDNKQFKIICPICGKILKNKYGWAYAHNRFKTMSMCDVCEEIIICSLELSIDGGGKIVYEKTVKKISGRTVKKMLFKGD